MRGPVICPEPCDPSQWTTVSKPASTAVTSPPSAVNGTGKEGAANSRTGEAPAAEADCGAEERESASAAISAVTSAATVTRTPWGSPDPIPARKGTRKPFPVWDW